MAITRSQQTALWVNVKFLSDANREQEERYWEWVEKNPTIHPIQCPVLKEMPYNNLPYKEIKWKPSS